jgi:antitoxin component YwqK of YwqJK toxin-antitoxin module
MPLSAFMRQPDRPKLSSICIIDRNGFSETISNADRLKQYSKVDFLQPQPYQKVLRIYTRNQKGEIRSYITSYFPNGNIKQYLEAVNGRAFGAYFEWHPNGSMSLATDIIGGAADITPAAQQSWLFDGVSRVWDEEENLIAEIPYEKGELEGISIYRYSNGQVWKRVPFHKNRIEGDFETYIESGKLLQKSHYEQGEKNGLSMRYWPNQNTATKEEYIQGKLKSGRYFDDAENLISQVDQGNGFRVQFGSTAIAELQEYRKGLPEGEVKVFGKNGELTKIYHIKNDIKHGEENDYYPMSGLLENAKPIPKLSVSWYEGKIQGIVKTWYENGMLESQREMSNNTKNGVYTAWYRDGNLMFIEEYDHDKLEKGQYFKKGEKTPVSTISNAKGIASLFDADGNFLQKVLYNHGKPAD